jgi:uncharacterized protein YrrD
MIRGTELVGRAVVDMDAAEKMGHVKEIIIERDGERIAGFVAVQGDSMLGGGTRRTIPAAALHAIGPDAITVHGSEAVAGAVDLATLPRMSDVTGRKMVTRSGQLLGSIGDLLVNPEDGSIIGFAFGEGVKSKLESMFATQKAAVQGYVRANADLQVGADLIVVPDEAVVLEEATTSAGSAAPIESEMPRAGERKWGSALPQSDRRSVWGERGAADRR